MRYHVLAADYDGTLAHHGRIDDATWLSPSDRADMTQRMTKSQQSTRERAAAVQQMRAALVQQLHATVQKLLELEHRVDNPT